MFCRTPAELLKMHVMVFQTFARSEKRHTLYTMHGVSMHALSCDEMFKMHLLSAKEFLPSTIRILGACMHYQPFKPLLYLSYLVYASL